MKLAQRRRPGGNATDAAAEVMFYTNNSSARHWIYDRPTSASVTVQWQVILVASCRGLNRLSVRRRSHAGLRRYIALVCAAGYATVFR
jgi:hypothetical protein